VTTDALTNSPLRAYRSSPSASSAGKSVDLHAQPDLV
jgi:hypothetical protein